MKLSRVVFLLALALGLFAVGAGGFIFYQQKQSAQELALIEARTKALLASVKPYHPIYRPLPDLEESLLPEAYPRPKSEWKISEESVYRQLLAAGQFDLLIVPFQVEEHALDRSTRSLMAAVLALEASAAANLRIADPYLVAEALSGTDRRIDADEVYRLADMMQVKKVVWGYVGHNTQNQMALTIQVQERDEHGVLNASTQSASHSFERVAFSDERPPIEAYLPLLPEVLNLIGIEAPAEQPTQESRIDDAEFPPDPMAIVSETPNPARDALYFQLLATLTPHGTERIKQRFAEKSFLATLNISPDSPDFRLLRARALMLLGLRPAALRTLAEPKTVAEQELFAMLNGNQPDVESFSSKMQPSVKKILAKADANELARLYAQRDKSESFAAAESLKLPGKIWPFLAARAFTDQDIWAQFDNLALKRLLDQDFPIPDYQLDAMIRGAASLGDAEKLQTLVNLAVVDHVRKLLEVEAAKWCCQFAVDRPSAMDYLNLIAAIGEDNLMRHADFLTSVQGMADQGLEFLSEIESVYKGHPRFAQTLAQAQFKKADSAAGAEKEGLQKSAYANAMNAYYWEQGQTELAEEAFELLRTIGRYDYGYRSNIYAADYPYRPFYSEWAQGGSAEASEANAQAALRNSTSNIRPFNYLNWHYTEFIRDDDKHQRLLKAVEGRFIGLPAMYYLKAKNSLMQGDIQTAEKMYRQSIKLQPNASAAYMELGNLLFEQGQLSQAAKLFMDYPGLRNENKNPVAVSNYAYTAGSRFFWLGEFSLAKPLYEIAAHTDTGSQADITSRLRLKLLDGNYLEALQGSLERAKRYNDTYAFRDYLSMLHAFGESPMAWDAFKILENQIDDSHIWESVLVGHRREGKSEADIAAWVNQQVKQNVGKNTNLAAKYFLRAGVTDRMPGMQFSNALAELAPPAWKMENRFGQVVESREPNLQLVLGPRAPEGNSLPIGEFERVNKSRVKSNLVYFAEAYQAIRLENFAYANTLLREAATFYDLSQNNLAYILPYYAFAAAKAGDTAEIERYLADFNPKLQGFDYYLAQAVLAGIGGKTDESVRLLEKALYKRPYTEDRPLATEYQYAEICLRLYKATGKQSYKNKTLDWVKKNQKFQPWFAWAYAMEAVLADNKSDRDRAIAMTAYLDPHSEMLGQIPQKDREAAIKKFNGKNPFLIGNQTKGREAI